MKHVSLLIASSIAMIALSGCATTGMNTRTGYAFIGNTTETLAVTNAAGSSKTGKACVTNLLGIFVQGDSSIATAKKEAGIKTVSSVEASTFNVGGFYGNMCTIVHGE